MLKFIKRALCIITLSLQVLVIANAEVVTDTLRSETGENIKFNNDVYSMDVYNNYANVSIDFYLPDVDESDLVILNDKNYCVGEVEKQEKLVAIVSLKDGVNNIRVVNKNTYENLLNISINYKRADIQGITDKVVTGDTILLKCLIDGKEYKTSWMTYGIENLIVSKSGVITPISHGVGQILGTIYDENGDIKGSLKAGILIIGDDKLGWIKNDNNWYYVDSTNKVHRGWLSYNGKKYYFNIDGIMQNSVVNINGMNYYFNCNGELID